MADPMTRRAGALAPGEAVTGEAATGEAVTGEAATGVPATGRTATGAAPAPSAAMRASLAHGLLPEIEPIVVDWAGERATLNGAPLAGVDLSIHGARARLTVAGTQHRVLLTPLPDIRRSASGVTRVEVVIDGWRFEVDLESAAHARLRARGTGGNGAAGKGGPLELRAIIPGRVVSVDVAEGDTVEAGTRLLVIEAMKMQNELRAPRDGTIGRVAVGPGDRVELGDLLLVIE
jgi:biotin carboxyl carrier protein